jgi:hypothetical protein
MDGIIQPEETRLGGLTFPEAKPIEIGCVVRVGEETLSSMVLPIVY